MLVPESHYAMHRFHENRCCSAFSTNLLGSKYQMYAETYRGRVAPRWKGAFNAVRQAAINPKRGGQFGAEPAD